MATLVLTALGTAIGGPLGGALGALAGRQIDGLVFKPGGREGPRLTELAVTTSSYGTPISRQFGRMRVAGTIVWATDLAEHRDSHSNGKGKPSTTNYSYTASFAVALSSRPIVALGRVWADGKLLRGAAGDLKAAGTLRLHTGEADQAPDPLIAAAVGTARCPAYRGIAYAVFEDLALADFGNRIPALSFEIFADESEPTLAEIVGATLDDCDATAPLTGLAGFTADGPLADTLTTLDAVFPLACDVADTRLLLRSPDTASVALPLPEAATSSADGDFGGKAGHSQARRGDEQRGAGVLRYYDLDRDYQPGAQRASGRPAPGQPRTVELPAALAASDARRLIDRAASRDAWASQTLSWRIAEIDPALAPGVLVTVPGHPGRWRVTEWELRGSGVELRLVRASPTLASSGPTTDPGATVPPPDLSTSPTALVAFELPWDGLGSGTTPARFAALSSAGAGWSGAALFADRGDGNLIALGASGRQRSLLGSTATTLGSASPLLFDRTNAVEVRLVDPSQTLADSTMAGLAGGANRALLGNELIQFGRAEPLGAGRWRLSGLWRGRGGSEAAVSGHRVGEPFVVLDGSAIALDPEATDPAAAVIVSAIGGGDEEPATSLIEGAGRTRRPLAPVHGHSARLSDGALELGWTRRARGAWRWLDGVETPLNEQSERYSIVARSGETILARWESAQPSLTIAAGDASALLATGPDLTFAVSQIGDADVSAPLRLTVS